ncbi:acyl carrier protein [Micromonospora echinofusca]|uniref:Acyl carrier protein n=1 Tax=Micromonospora echinofusca TaxID=47858 RepID=A0ABS3VJP0_MICEH|nr:acyl carrier protein [Micromonospora echinofusca]MBO4204634.1 acyl carrier protein [Micromonospora echinofusca]
MTALRDRVAATVGGVLAVPVDSVTAAVSLFDLPGFDSVAVVTVLDRLESDFDVEVDPDEIGPEVFESLDTLTDLVGRALAGPTTTGGTR